MHIIASRTRFSNGATGDTCIACVLGVNKPEPDSASTVIIVLYHFRDVLALNTLIRLGVNSLFFCNDDTKLIELIDEFHRSIVISVFIIIC